MKSVTFYAYLDREDGSTHGACQPSPVFGTEPELVSWIRAHRHDGDEIHAIRREVDGSIVRDYPLRATEEEYIPTQEAKARVKVLVADLKAMLEEKKKELDKVPSSKPYSRVSEFNPIARPLTYDEVYPPEVTQ